MDAVPSKGSGGMRWPAWLNSPRFIILEPFIAAAYFAATVTAAIPWWKVYQFSGDEGINLMKSALVADGYKLYSEVWSDQPPILTALLVPLQWLCPASVNSARALILAFAALMAFSLFRIVAHSCGRPSAWIAVMAMTGEAIVVKTSVSVMIGTPAIALALAATDQCLLAAEKSSRRRFLGAGLLFGLALQTKLFVVLALPAIALAPLTQRRIRTDLRRSAIDLLVFLAAAVAVSLFVAMVFKIPLYSQLVTPHVDAETAKELSNIGGFKTVLSSLRPTFFILTAAAGAGAFALHRRLVYAIPIVWLVVAGTALSVHRPFWDHHAVLLMVPIAWLTGQGLLLVQLLSRRQAASWAFAALIVAVSAHDFVVLSKQMRKLAKQDTASPMLLRDQRAGNWVVTDYAMDAYRANSLVPPELAVYSVKRRATGGLSDQDVAKIVQQYRPTEILLRRFPPSPEVMAIAPENYRPVSAASDRFDAVRSDVSIPGQESVVLEQAVDALVAAASDISSRATEGGYPGHFDLTSGNRYGRTIKDEPLQPNEIIARPPGATQDVGQCMRRAYKATGRDVFRREAISAGLGLACAQRDAGGWNQIATLHEPCDAPRNFNAGSTPELPMTLDDGATPSAISFLLDIRSDLLSEGAQLPAWLQPALDLSLKALLDAQDQNGGWPQQVPAGSKRGAKYTFNDRAIQSAIEVLVKAYRQLGDRRFFTAAMNGAMFIIATQGRGVQAGWGQQYDTHLSVSGGRNFEPPGYGSLETGEIVNTLLDLYLDTGDERLAVAIERAVLWLWLSEFRPQYWARLYEIGTNRPIYGDRDGSVHYRLKEISEERRQGYKWQGSFTEVLRALERQRIRREHGTGALKAFDSWSRLPRRLSPEQWAKVANLIDQVQTDGRWADGSVVATATFVENCKLLSDAVVDLKLTAGR